MHRFNPITWLRERPYVADGLFAVDANLVNRPGIRILDGATTVCEQLERARNQMESKP